jgi:hypothetical protein
MNVRLHIERLVIDGVPVPAGGGRRMEAAVTKELTRLLARGKLHPALGSGGAIPQLRGGTIHLDAGRNPASMGTQLARAIYGGLRNPEAS